MSTKASRKLQEYGYVLYRVYTEDANRQAVVRALQHANFPPLPGSSTSGFTLTPAVGYGEGQHGNMECSLVCDVVVPYTDETDDRMHMVFQQLRRDNNDQTAVLIVRVPCFPEMIWNTESNQGAFEFALVDKQRAKCTVDLQKVLSSRRTATELRRGKIVAKAGKWEALLTRHMRRQPGSDEIEYTNKRENQSMIDAIIEPVKRITGF